MKKFLDSDWLRAMQFNCNTSAKSVTPVKITHRIVQLRIRHVRWKKALTTHLYSTGLASTLKEIHKYRRERASNLKIKQYTEL